MKSKKFLGLLLAIILIISLLPITALAADGDWEIDYEGLIAVITKIEFTITPPECGTVVTAEEYPDVKGPSDYDWNTQSPIPAVTLPADVPYELDEVEDMFLYGYWCEDENAENIYVSSEEHPFMKGGETFYADIYLRAKEGYVFPPSEDIPMPTAPENEKEAPSMALTINVTGGTVVSYDLYGGEGESQYIEIIVAVDIEHIDGPVTTENVVPATCLEDGSHDDVLHCAYCEEELSRTTVGDVALGHDWDAWFVSKEASVGVNGEEMRICKRDSSHVETRALSPKTGDHNSFGLWIALSVISAGLIVCLIIFIRPKRKEDRK